MNKYQIFISQRAFSDITQCVLFVNNVSSQAAKELYYEIMAAIQALSSFPNKYPEIQDLKIGDNKYRKMPVHQGRYMVVYRVEVNTVIISDIIDSRKNVAWFNL